MATTSNYGWTTPDDSSLVKDGASAIRTLGSAIDTSLNTALGTKKAGLVLLNTTSFSGVSSVSLPADTFSSTYTNYAIKGFANVSSAGTIGLMRLRASGADNTTSNYFSATLGLGSNGNASNTNAQASTSFTLQRFVSSNTNASFEFDIFNPKASAKTNFNGTGTGTNSAGSEYVTCALGGIFDATTSFDSLTIFPTAGTFTGTISVYAYAI